MERIHSIFIDEKMCTLVTEHSLTQAGIKGADKIFSHLIDLEIINSIGEFLPNITEHTIKQFCSSNKIDDLFLKTAFIMQKCISQLSGKELSFWNHKLRDLHLQLFLQQLTGGDNNVCNELLVHINQMQRHYGEPEVLNLIKLLYSQSKRDVPNDMLVELFSRCSSKEWMFSIVNSQIKQRTEQVTENSSPSLLKDLRSFDWESVRNKEEEQIQVVGSNSTSIMLATHFQMTRRTIEVEGKGAGFKDKVSLVSRAL